MLVLLKADVTANNAEDRALLKRFHLFGPPGTIFFDGAVATVSAPGCDRLPEQRGASSKPCARRGCKTAAREHAVLN